MELLCSAMELLKQFSNTKHCTSSNEHPEHLSMAQRSSRRTITAGWGAEELHQEVPDSVLVCVCDGLENFVESWGCEGHDTKFVSSGL